MGDWLPAFLVSFGVISVAALGDKSRLMAMAGTRLVVPTLLAALASVFGRDHAEYRDRTGRFLPRIGTR